MDYDRIIIEMLNRISVLEEKVHAMEKNATASTKQPGTAEIKAYIEEKKSSAKKEGKPYVCLVANDIHKALHLSSRIPTVCNAMTQCMKDGDEVIRKTASGFSTTFEIKYYL